MYQSMDFFQFQKRFATEPRCRNYLIKQRWSVGFICPRCHHRRGYFIKKRASFQCQRCRYQTSVTAGTVFHKTKTPLRKWFWMIYLLSQSKNGYSVLALQKLLNINHYRTAWLMAFLVISSKTIRLTGTLGLSTSVRCQAMASPSRSSSVAT